jgi:Sec-independent protein secretion pathway component TatC
MSKHVAADGFASVGTCEKSTGTRVGLNLIDDQDGDVELLCHLAELAEVLAQLALAFVQFSTAMVVVAEVCHDAVDDEKAVLPGREGLGETTELVVLVFAVLRTDIEDVLVGGLVIDCALSVCFMVS